MVFITEFVNAFGSLLAIHMYIISLRMSVRRFLGRSSGRPVRVLSVPVCLSVSIYETIYARLFNGLMFDVAFVLKRALSRLFVIIGNYDGLSSAPLTDGRPFDRQWFWDSDSRVWIGIVTIGKIEGMNL